MRMVHFKKHSDGPIIRFVYSSIFSLQYNVKWNIEI